jgi:uncharacterized protein (TIGR00661 family)
MGHATRSKVVISHLLKNHNVHIVSSSRAYQFLNESFPRRVQEIEGFYIGFKDTRVSKMKTFTDTVKSSPKSIKTNVKGYFTLKANFKPDLVISDFESFSYLFAKRHGIPVISIDNMQVMNRCKLDIKVPEEEKDNFKMAKTIVKMKVPNISHYLITAFFDAEPRKENTTMVKPILRDAIIKTHTSEKKHILVYQSTSNQSNVVSLLQQTPTEEFFMYGFNKDEKHGNVILKTFSKQGFIDDLASCKAVITNGGFSLISEAIYFHKPIYSYPLQGQFEQYLNAAYVDKMGYGRNFKTLHPDSLKAFLYDVSVFKSNLSSYEQDGNGELFERLDGLIGKVFKSQN